MEWLNIFNLGGTREGGPILSEISESSVVGKDWMDQRRE